MAAQILLLIVSCGAIAASYGYVRQSRRMRSYRTVDGRVVGRDVAVLPGGVGGEGRWGNGGRYRPKVTYVYTVDGVTHTSDRWSYASNGLKRAVAERQVAEVPDHVTVCYDPGAPGQAYLHTHPPRLGYLLLVAGAITAVGALVALLG